VSELAKYTRVLPVIVVVGLAAVLGIPIYAHMALRAVYGGSQGKTLLKEAGIGGLYLIASAPVMIGLVFWAARGS
jgi:hypothetical protein